MTSLPAGLVQTLRAELPRQTIADACGATVPEVTLWLASGLAPDAAAARLGALAEAIRVYRRRRPKGNLNRWLGTRSEHLDCDLIEAIRGDADEDYLRGLVHLRGLEQDW